LHVAAYVGNLDIMLKLWEWAQKIITTKEMNNKLLLAKDKKGMSVLYVVVYKG